MPIHTKTMNWHHSTFFASLTYFSSSVCVHEHVCVCSYGYKCVDNCVFLLHPAHTNCIPSEALQLARPQKSPIITTSPTRCWPCGSAAAGSCFPISLRGCQRVRLSDLATFACIFLFSVLSQVLRRQSTGVMYRVVCEQQGNNTQKNVGINTHICTNPERHWCETYSAAATKMYFNKH